jgi:hypothetical protein
MVRLLFSFSFFFITPPPSNSLSFLFAALGIPWLMIQVDELFRLCQEDFPVWDAFERRYFMCRVRLFGVIADLPAKGQLLNFVTSFSLAESWCCICTTPRSAEMQTGAISSVSTAALRNVEVARAKAKEFATASRTQQAELRKAHGTNGTAHFLFDFGFFFFVFFLPPPFCLARS